jgi:hypothetical protein
MSLTAQLATWTVASLAMVVLWFRVFKPEFPENPHRHLGWRSHR